MRKLTLLFLHVAASLVVMSSHAANHVEFHNAEGNSLPFSAAVRVGNVWYLSGQLGLDSKTGKLVPGGIEAEAAQTMDNIKAVLETQGLSMADLVKCTVMLADISEWSMFNEVYVRYFEPPYPARSAFGANGLALGARVEVECIAGISE